MKTIFTRQHYRRIAHALRDMPEVINKRDLIRRFNYIFIEDGNENYEPTHFWRETGYEAYKHIAELEKYERLMEEASGQHQPT